ncbi:MAG: preprotein translocase subunit SecE [Dethiobacter sp.]|jgi:preprotein translocase subunit SecE|nr:preprotein translocase subunit SecE [Dethiobacter sp.]MBS3897431.1 preprotein translocase subunit SecE [Dethiobacter sp.]MBS3982913.1 preprotein translocase subunit SecE [Dethiobacter sp.]MCL4464372.1 preprotein translocase subunit SecE [Bacillota bacterium]MCL5993534.1 preprotein translocase subunit SecE [Bacillota bacterium]
MSENVKVLTKHLKDVRQELRKVHWPNRRELSLFTSMVLMAIFFIGVFFWILDSGFAGVLRIILQR